MGSPPRPIAVLAAALLLAAACGQGRPSSAPVSGSGGPPATSAASAARTAGPAASGAASARPTGSERSFDASRVKVTLDAFVDGLSAPLAIANAGDGSDRLFVAEQDGRIRLIRDGRVIAAQVLDISERI